jgi:hypothetical protein
MRRAVIILGVVGCLLILMCFGVVLSAPQYDSEGWKTLAKTNTSDGGYCFVRQMRSSILFSDVGFGYVDHSGTNYCYPLENDGFHWHGVRLVEKGGNIHVWRRRSEVAVFNPGRGYFTNLVIRYTFNEKDSIPNGLGSSFFENLSQ